MPKQFGEINTRWTLEGYHIHIIHIALMLNANTHLYNSYKILIGVHSTMHLMHPN